MSYLDYDGLALYDGLIKNKIGEKLDADASAKRTSGILYGEVDSTSTSTAFTATVAGLTELYHGAAVLLKNGVVTSASGFTVNINNLGAKPVYSNMAATTRETTLFNVNYTLLLIYDEDRVDGGCWLNYRGYYSDANSIGYQLRTNSSTLPAQAKFYRYRLLFTSADGTHWVPANTSTSTSADTAKTPNTTPIDPFGPIAYYSTTSAVNASANVGSGYQWQQYAFNLGYSFNGSGSALTLTYPAPVYIKCHPLADGSATIDATTPYTQALPSTADGCIYIYLGRAYSATNVELVASHPIYWHDGTKLRLWSGSDFSEITSMQSTIADKQDKIRVSVSMGGSSVSFPSNWIEADDASASRSILGFVEYGNPTEGNSDEVLYVIPSYGLLNTINTSIGGKADSNHTHSVATSSAAGFMSSADKSKLDGFSNASDYLTESGFQQFYYDSVNTWELYPADATTKAIIISAVGSSNDPLPPNSNIWSVFGLMLAVNGRWHLAWMNGTMVDMGQIRFAMDTSNNSIILYARGLTSVASGVMGVDSSWTVTPMAVDANGVSF